MDLKIDDHRPIREKYIWPNAADDHGYSRVFQEIYSNSQAETGGDWTIGTLPTSLSAQQLSTYIPREFSLATELGWTLRTSQPVVMSLCSPTSNHAGNISYYNFNGSTSTLHNATGLYDALSWVNTTIPYPMSWIQIPQEPTSLLACLDQGQSRYKNQRRRVSQKSAPRLFYCLYNISVLVGNNTFVSHLHWRVLGTNGVAAEWQKHIPRQIETNHHQS